jgi:hypothetical protein
VEERDGAGVVGRCWGKVLGFSGSFGVGGGEESFHSGATCFVPEQGEISSELSRAEDGRLRAWWKRVEVAVGEL